MILSSSNAHREDLFLILIIIILTKVTSTEVAIYLIDSCLRQNNQSDNALQFPEVPCNYIIHIELLTNQIVLQFFLDITPSSLANE